MDLMIKRKANEILCRFVTIVFFLPHVATFLWI